jgi:hypothetical protein
MKRIALLLAAVGLGSGCVVNTCDTGTLTVDWRFQDATGRTNLLCNDPGLSQFVNDVDIYIDGVAVATFVPCTDYGATIGNLSSGGHNVVVEGYDSGGFIVARDMFGVSVAACGDSFFAATPGEAIIDVQPTNCSLGADNLTYELVDVTRTPYVISSIVPTDTVTKIQSFTCGGGIHFPVPWGSYDLTKIEEVNGDASTVYASKCTTTAADVPVGSWGTVTTNVAFTDVAACTW